MRNTDYIGHWQDLLDLARQRGAEIIEELGHDPPLWRFNGGVLMCLTDALYLALTDARDIRYTTDRGIRTRIRTRISRTAAGDRTWA